MPATIKDIARQLHISYATVSRALNGRYGVKASTRQRVLEAAQELNYHPDAAARQLVTRRTKTIGLILPDIQNPFYPEVASGVERTAAALGYMVFLCITDWNLERQAEYIHNLLEKRVEGLIIAPIEQSHPQVRSVVADHFPVVYVSDTQVGEDSSYVAIDNVRGGYLATAHLIESGYTPVYYFGAPQDHLTNRERYAGYRKALREHGLKPQPSWVLNGNYQDRNGYFLINQLLDQGIVPRAVFAVNDSFALGVLQGVRQRGLRIPGDVAVVGFDDIPMASYPEIQLTTVAQPKVELGRLAVEILERRIQGKDTGHPEKVLLEPQLVVRGSTSLNPVLARARELGE